MIQDYKNFILKSFVFFILLLFVGLPINKLLGFFILLFFIPIIIFSKIRNKNNYILISLVIISFFFIKNIIPNIKIQEGNNIVILNENSKNFYKNNLPNEIYKFLENKFIFYNNSTCDLNDHKCWKNFKPSKNLYSFSADWSFKEIKFSRIINDINFSNLQTARIGEINNLKYNYFWPKKFDIVRENLPFFVKYEIPEILNSSSICWSGNIFWPKNTNEYILLNSKSKKCRKISDSDIGKYFYGVSLGSNNSFERLNYLYTDNYINKKDQKFKNFLSENQLSIKLEKNLILKFYFILDLLFEILFILLIFYLFFNFTKKIYLFSFFYSLVFLICLNFIDKNIIYGFNIFTGGNDGLVYMSYGNEIFKHLLNYNFYEALRGVESIFYFPSSLRYFWAINKLFFGETSYGYTLIGYLYIIVLFFIFKFLLGFIWSFILSLLILFTRVFEGYALSSYKYFKHINAGDAEPLSIFFLLLSLLLFIIIISKNKLRTYLLFSFLFGFFIFLSITLRPNYLPTGILLLFSLLIFNYINNKILFSSFFAILGFSLILIIPLHNYIYGNSFVLLSSGYQHNTHAPISLYYYSFIDIINLNWSNSENIQAIGKQLYNWIQPREVHYIISFLFLIIILFINNSFILKTICILALSQHFVLIIFEPDNRYAYLAWILTFIAIFSYIINNFHKLNIFFKK